MGQASSSPTSESKWRGMIPPFRTSKTKAMIDREQRTENEERGAISPHSKNEATCRGAGGGERIADWPGGKEVEERSGVESSPRLSARSRNQRRSKTVDPA